MSLRIPSKEGVTNPYESWLALLRAQVPDLLVLAFLIRPSGGLKPCFGPILPVRDAELSFKSRLFQVSPPENTGNSQRADGQTDIGTMIDAPTSNPRDKAHIHGMPELFEHPPGNQMVNVFYPSELSKSRQGKHQPEDEDGETNPSKQIGWLYAKGV